MRNTSKALSEAELAAIEAARAAARERFKHFADDTTEDAGPIDPDNPPMTDEQLARLRPAAEVVPGLVAASLRRKGGRPKSEAPKVSVSLRLDSDVVAALRKSGQGWQSRVNAKLRKDLKL